MIHKKKIIPSQFNDILIGSKRFDLRDRSDGYVTGETITFMEYDGTFTGREIDVKITYLSDYEQKEGNIIVGFEVCKSFSSVDVECEGISYDPDKKIEYAHLTVKVDINRDGVLFDMDYEEYSELLEKQVKDYLKGVVCETTQSI